jgi:sodium/hydrogen exchanger 8
MCRIQVVVLGLCILSAYLINKYQFYYLPESAAAILVGLIVGVMARMVYPSKEELQFLSLEQVGLAKRVLLSLIVVA